MFTKTLLPDTLRAIQLVSNVPEIKKAYLAGGTALALQIGHRISIDLDFFIQYEFNGAQLIAKLASLPEFVQDGTAQWTVWGKIGQTKFSMFYYKYPLLEQAASFEGIQLASLADIAAMKIHAIEDRLYTILRALDYFEDAEQEKQMPKMITSLNWEAVKEYFRIETHRLTEKKLQV